MAEDCDELLVYMDFNSKVDDDLFNSEKEFKIIGIDTDEPVLQLGNQVFQGVWKDSIGTHVMFQEGEQAKNDPLFSEPPSKQMYYSMKTNKTLHMSRIFVNPKGNIEDVTNKNEINIPDKEIINVVPVTL